MKPILFSRFSIRQRLPVLICVLLLAVILVFGFISYIGVKKAALKVGQDRLQTLSEQLSTMFSGNVHAVISTTHAAANKPAIKKYLLSNGSDSAGETLKLLQDLRKDSLYARVELRNSDQKLVLISAKEGVHIHADIDSLLFIARPAKPDSGRVGKLYAIDNSVYYPVMVTVTEQNKLLGYLIRWRKMTASPQALERLSQLMGTGAKFYIGNTDGELWTDMIRPVSLTRVTRQNKNTITEYSKSKNNTVLASIRPVANSQWLIAVELSKKKIMESANQFLDWLIIAGSVLLVIGVFAARVMSRNITSPLQKLTTAASGIAAGNYSTRVPNDRFDELGKLGRAFNAMAAQVKKSKERLEEKAQKYKLLFEKNPVPMWILAKPALGVLDANEAALSHYGYSRDEFLKLNAKDLRPEEDIEKYLAHTKETQGTTRSGIWRHKKKDGTIIMVDIIADDIVFKHQPARLVLANDVTEKLKAEAELSRQFFLRQKLVTETTIQAQEKEREEIGKELHDNINQILAAAKLYLEIALSGNREMFREAAMKSHENVTLAIHEIRQLSKQLVGPAFEETLNSAIKELVNEIQSVSGIKMKLDIEKMDEEFLSENIKLVLYRIVQEQVNNIIKHSRAKNVTIKIQTKFDEVSLTIADDGVGFDTTKKPRGIGLRNIASRVGFYDGVVNIESRPGYGCILQASIPLTQEQNASASSA